MSDMKSLQVIAKGYSVLYAEDNVSLRENASKLLKKIFKNVLVASDGKEALELFKRDNAHILITDIKMPKMSGMELAKHVKSISPETKIIIMSAFDDKEYLFEGIEIGVFRFLKKPVRLSELSDVLYKAIVEIKHEKNVKLFYSNLKNIFNYQSAMVVMIHESTPVLANQIFLDFFALEAIGEFAKKHRDFSKLFLPHDGFLYNHEKVEWFLELTTHEKKLFHIKLLSKNNEIKHFILKCQSVPEKENYWILSFDDVTDLNLLKLFDAKTSKSDESIQDAVSMMNLLEVIQRNSAKIQLHNYYKGLSITNSAIITEIGENSVTLKTNYVQEKAIKFEMRTTISSEALPNPIVCSKVSKLSFETQCVELSQLRFAGRSPLSRSTIRLVPAQPYSISIFVRENKFQAEIEIVDVSVDAIKVKLSALPAGLQKDDEVRLDMVFTLEKRPLIINTNAKLFRKEEREHSFELVFTFNFVEAKKKDMITYITKRQMEIIREFKGL